MATYYNWKRWNFDWAEVVKQTINGGKSGYQLDSWSNVSLDDPYAVGCLVMKDGPVYRTTGRWFYLDVSRKMDRVDMLFSGGDGFIVVLGGRQENLPITSGSCWKLDTDAYQYSYVDAITSREGQYVKPMAYYGPFKRVAIEAKKSTQDGDVWDTDSGKYPNGGVSGSYYYDGRTSVVSPTVPVNVDFPVTVFGTATSIGFSAAQSKTVYPVASYEVEYSVDGDGWTLAGNYTASPAAVTIPSGKESVQFRIRAKDSNGAYGDYVMSGVIPVVAEGALLISGADTDLGNITGGHKYTAYTNTGKAISITEKVDSVVRSHVIESGQNITIPVERMTSGTGSITITATIAATSGAATATREWTYTKAAAPAPEGPYKVERLEDEKGNAIFPQTLAEAVYTQSGARLDTILASLNALSGGIVPSGCILAWSGAVSAIPDGWLLCDGTNGTPDLRGRFLLGAGGDYSVAAQGGSKTKTLTTANLPSHSHGSGSLSTNSAGRHSHTWACYGGSEDISVDDGAQEYRGTKFANLTSTDGLHNHVVTGTTGNTGSGTAFDIMPPYYALCYIMRR